MTLSDKQGVQHIIQTLAALGLKEVIICPGSRNAPLVVSFNRHPQFRCTSIRDERSAAFFAMGKALTLNEPVAVLCSSGTAVLNLAPAIAEAYYQRIPLIILTADRPQEWIDQGDGQTMNQSGVYANYIRKSYDLKEAVHDKNAFWYNERCLSEGFYLAAQANRGPVHFNIPMSEPLYGTSEVTVPAPKVFTSVATRQEVNPDALRMLADQFNNSKSVMVLVGQHAPDKALEQLLVQLAGFDNLVVLTESTSNVHHPLFVAHIDRCITGMDSAQSEAMMPELLITVGGAIVSKRIKSLLRQHRPAHQWNIHPYEATMDTYQALTTVLPLQATSFLTQILPLLSPPAATYKRHWQALQTFKEERHQDFSATAAYSDFQVFDHILREVPQDICLHLGNSSPIRYAQLFDYSKVREVWSNRGVSGIDGCTSTAMGAAAAAPGQKFLLLTGDVSFYYDLNALWNDTPVENLNIILINNSGGGIFRIIEGPNQVAERSEFLETSQQRNAEKIAAQFDWQYLAAGDEGGLKECLASFFLPQTKRTILEIFTDAEQNPQVLTQYWKFLNK